MSFVKKFFGGAARNAKDSDGKTALMKAAQAGNSDDVKPLIAAGADVSARDKAEGTPLMSALSSDHEHCVTVLIAAGADVNTKDMHGATALMFTSEGRLAKALIAAGADVNAKDAAGVPVLVRALSNTEKGRITCGYWGPAGAEEKATDSDCIKVLLDSGADVNPKFLRGDFTPLMGAATANDADSVRLLVAAGADLNAKSHGGS